MAIKLTGSISRKVPIEGVQFSSQQFGGALEIEVNSEDPVVIKEKLHNLYINLGAAIDAEIAAATHQSGQAQGTPAINTAAARSQPAQAPQQPIQQQRNGYSNGTNRVAATNGNGNGNGRGTGATQAQQRAIFAICKSQGIDMAAVLADFNVGDPKDLHVKDASRLIDQLKSQNGNGAAAH